MGFRSDVYAICCMDEYKEAIKKLTPDNPIVELLSRAKCFKVSDKNNEFMVLLFEYVKWYEDFKDVQAFKQFIRELPSGGLLKILNEDNTYEEEDLEGTSGDMNYTFTSVMLLKLDFSDYFESERVTVAGSPEPDD